MAKWTTETFETDNNLEIIDEIMTTYGQEILQLVYSYVNNKELAEDLTQDIFVKCYHTLHTFKGKSKFRTWLWQIAINTCKDYLKSWYNKNVVHSTEDFLFDIGQKDSVEDAIIQQDRDARLVSSIMQLPIKYREVIYLYYFEELRIKEISNLVKVKQNTIKTRLRKAKELIKKEMEADYNGK
ncbi:ECF RNA polymerase sigma factor SigW [Paraliobacillus sp. PM-2]|uniref:sigma-70 family RNA polymerase sigma factor n=1 Tax=Paraliobacillus sp. PM-2 TaxID=1462524 RepID=UPI00061C7BFA|nr:sigma-70 family RNA polymerase sigma factor [Paraliobacillus sp. PM-2]CQR48080.1 ECF RNA polymerase sigma factor SigW [Paraliobacillus sp. PM-2]